MALSIKQRRYVVKLFSDLLALRNCTVEVRNRNFCAAQRDHVAIFPAHHKVTRFYSHARAEHAVKRTRCAAALQMAITAFSNVFVQGYINHFGADCMSGWTAYSKIDQLILLPVQSISLASTTFVGQNLGINRVERAKRGVRTALCLGTGATILIMIPVMIFAPQLVTFFNGKAEVVAYGTLLLRWISPFYVLACFNQIYAGALRGAGNSRAPMVIMLCSFVLFRQCYLYIMANFISNEIIPIAMGYPAGWLVCSVATGLYFRNVELSSTRIVENAEAAEAAEEAEEEQPGGAL